MPAVGKVAFIVLLSLATSTPMKSHEVRWIKVQLTPAAVGPKMAIRVENGPDHDGQDIKA